MNAEEKNAERAGPSGGGPFDWRRAAVWLPCGLLLGVLAAWAAVDAQMYFAPLFIFPLLVGIGLGAFLVLLMRAGQVGHRPTIVLGTLLAALAATFGQHYFGYLLADSRSHSSNETIERAKAALHLQPSSFREFMEQQAARGRPVLNLFVARDGGAWTLWTIEGMLTLAGALGVVIPAMRLPYCSRCRSWYRATRAARFSAAVVPRIAKAIEVEVAEKIKSGRCRLLNCSSGCGPTGCVLSWEDLDGNTFFAQVWLDTSARNAVVRIFDEELCEINDE